MLEHTGLTESTVVVFGDHMNDLEMFNMADEALAVPVRGCTQEGSHASHWTQLRG